MAYEDTVLLQLRRQYSEKEAIAFLLDQVKKAKLEIGMLRSEKHELEHKMRVLTKDIGFLQKKVENQKKELQARHDKIVDLHLKIQTDDRVINLQKQKKELTKKFRLYQDKYLSLRAKYEPITTYERINHTE